MGSASFPSLVFSSEPEREERNLYDVVDKTNRVKRLCMGGGIDFLMSTLEDGGWVLLRDRGSEELFLFNLASSQRIPVPPLDDEGYEFTFSMPHVYDLVDPYTKKNCRLHLPQLSGSILYSSRDGWFVVHKTKEELFLFNLFTQVDIQVPTIAKSSSVLYGLALSSPPTSSDCMVFGIHELYDVGSISILFY